MYSKIKIAGHPLRPQAGLAAALDLIGVALTVAGGFLGWKLVQKQHVGVDLTPEQQRFEPRPVPRSERSEPSSGIDHGQRVG